MVPFEVMNDLGFYLRFWPLGFRMAEAVSVHISSQGSKKLKYLEGHGSSQTFGVNGHVAHLFIRSIF